MSPNKLGVNVDYSVVVEVIYIYNTICNDALRIFDYPVFILMMMVLGMDGGCADGGGTRW